MQYELTTLHEKFNDKLKPDTNQKQLNGWLDSIIKESERIKSVFLTMLFIEKPESVQKKYFQVQQEGLLKLVSQSAKLYQSAKKENKSQVVEIYDLANKCIVEILFLLEKHFREYLSLDFVVPASVKNETILYVADRRHDIEKFLKDVDKRLSEIVLRPLNEFIEEENAISYRRLYFIRAMTDGLLSVTEQKDKLSHATRAICDTLFHVNFNCTSFYYYCKDQILMMLQSKKDLVEQLYKLNRLEKYISEIQVKPGLVYKQQRIDIPILLGGWLQDMTRMKNKEFKMMVDELKTSLEEYGADSKKVITNLTVPELGLVIRLFIEAGVFQTKNKKALARFMVKNVVTFQKTIDEDISVDHLYSTIYTSTEPTIASMEAMLKRMLRVLDKVKEDTKNKKPSKN